jgi:hypothetical protein
MFTCARWLNGSAVKTLEKDVFLTEVSIFVHACKSNTHSQYKYLFQDVFIYLAQYDNLHDLRNYKNVNLIFTPRYISDTKISAYESSSLSITRLHGLQLAECRNIEMLNSSINSRNVL